MRITQGNVLLGAGLAIIAADICLAAFVPGAPLRFELALLPVAGALMSRGTKASGVNLHISLGADKPEDQP